MRIIFTIYGLYNFIRKRDIIDNNIFETGKLEINKSEKQNEKIIPLIIYQGMDTFRIQIAKDMFEQWQAYTGARSRADLIVEAG